MRHLYAVIFTLVMLHFGGCEKIEYIPDNPINGIPTKVLMHR